MASENHPPTLMNIPLEVRHQIFGYVAVRDAQPKKLLRYWFEKKEVKEKKAELAAKEPGAGVPQVVFEGDQFEHEELDDKEGQSEEDGEEDNEGEEEEGDEDEDEEHDDEDDDDNEDEEEDVEAEEDEVNEQGEEEDEDNNRVDGNDEDGEEEPAPLIIAQRKWRHIPKFMRITHCPPPIELLLTSKQLNNEAKSWFYDVAVLRIEATGSFAHTSFFEEAFSQITEAAFSPMENIRKVEVTFVWDTTWLRADDAGCTSAIFPALLRQRAAFVIGTLAQAPNLKKVTIHWHDSAEDEESVDLMNDVLAGFLGLNAEVKVETHYIAADVKPRRKSVAGKRRVEFQNIVDMGLDRLF